MHLSFPNRFTLLAGLGLLAATLNGCSRPGKSDRPLSNGRHHTVQKTDQLVPATGQKRIPVIPLNQRQTNGCGTASLAMVLNALAAQLNLANVLAISQQELDKGNRELDSFSAPGMLVRVAEEYGAFAAMYNNSHFEEIRTHIDSDNLMIALIHGMSNGPNNRGLHYVVIHGYQDNPGNPQLRTITITDPATGQTRTQNYAEFEARYWRNLTWKSLPTLFNRMLIVVSAKNTLPPSRDVPFTSAIASIANAFMNALGAVAKGLSLLASFSNSQDLLPVERRQPIGLPPAVDQTPKTGK